MGVDSSPSLLGEARRAAGTGSIEQVEGADRKAGEAGTMGSIEWVEGDGMRLGEVQLRAEFDAVFSNAAIHWMKEDPQSVAAGVYGLLKDGGRFVGEVSS